MAWRDTKLPFYKEFLTQLGVKQASLIKVILKVKANKNKIAFYTQVQRSWGGKKNCHHEETEKKTEYNKVYLKCSKHVGEGQKC